MTDASHQGVLDKPGGLSHHYLTKIYIIRPYHIGLLIILNFDWIKPPTISNQF